MSIEVLQTLFDNCRHFQELLYDMLCHLFLVVSCGLPRVPANAYIGETDLLSGSDAMIMCDDGFQMSSGETSYNITCQPDGMWTSMSFTCNGKWRAFCL